MRLGHRRTNTSLIHLYDISEMVKLLEARNRMVGAKGLERYTGAVAN